ncbi:MAG TPA: ABC transporter permease [Chitinophagaceae bacterium]|nr:ABC transporter permease [Chitinophagaceae bacterium]
MPNREGTAANRSAWQRLKRNKAAMFGLSIIFLSVLLAIICYFIATDNSPNANRMVIEIGGKKPGYSQLFLKIPIRAAEDKGLLEQFVSGKSDVYQYVPITEFRRQEDSMIVEKYIDEGLTVRQGYSITQLNGAFQPNQFSIQKIHYWLGTDKYGRDILSRLLIGVRVSLAVGLVTVIISLSIGVLLGALAGYFRGWVDDVVMWVINVIWSIPTLLLVFAITLLLGKGFWQIFIAIGLTMWVSVARIIRGQVLSVRELEYVEAARALGFTNTRIIFRHILPNVMGPVLVVAASNFATAIIIEAGLSFLGVGVQPPQPSWGLMIKENYNFIITHNPMLALIPGMAIMLLVLAFNLLGNGLRDALEVRG